MKNVEGGGNKVSHFCNENEKNEEESQNNSFVVSDCVAFRFNMHITNSKKWKKLLEQLS